MCYKTRLHVHLHVTYNCTVPVQVQQRAYVKILFLRIISLFDEVYLQIFARRLSTNILVAVG
jgi:hypothetical protein